MSAEDLPAREAMEFDVVIVGAGPAGLAAAIRLKQLSPDTSVVVVEKGSEVGAHILSGAVVDPIGVDQLVPGWGSVDSPFKTRVSDDRVYLLASLRLVGLPALNELWQVAQEKYRPGLVQHTFGWPLDNRTGGGSFLYHFDDRLVSVGFVVHLNYENPYLSPYEEFQRFKNHPLLRPTFEGGKR